MKFFTAITAAFAVAQSVSGMSQNGVNLMRHKENEWQALKDQGLMPKNVASARNQAATCSGGSVTVNGESFPCSNIDFEGFLSLNDANIPGNGGTSAGSDIWGWLSPEGKEITLWCVDNGIWFIDTTNPAAMQHLGYMQSGRSKAAWCDVKVYENTAYVVKDGSTSPSSYGIEVFDLTRLVGLSASTTRSFSPDFVYTQHGRSHNLAVDTESGFLYSVGTTTCSGGLHIIDLSNPLQPTFSTCVSSDGYTHDAQCVVYDGPDTRFTGQQICFAFNEDTLTIWDVTNKNSVTRLARLGYSTAEYTHQGWLTEDMSFVIMNDELDETNGAVSRTTTYMVNVESLTAPFLASSFTHSELSPDHNLYVWGAIHKKGWGGNAPLNPAPSSKFAYLSNYVAGIKILDISNLPSVTQVGNFDLAPDFSGRQFEGAWSNYLHPSGVLAVSSIDRGLFTLRPNMVYEGPTPAPVPTVPVPVPTPAPVIPTAAPTPGCIFFC